MILLKKIGNFIWSKRFLVNFGLILLAYIIGGLILSQCLSYSTNNSQKLEVPNLIGKNQNNLASLMADSELLYEVLDSIYDPSKVAGTIMEQDPLPTAKSNIYVKEGRTIKLRVSKRTLLVEMPDLVDKSQRFAEGILRNREFRYKLDYQPSKEAHGAVIEQLYKGKRIAAGQKIPIGSKVVLIVGRNEVGTIQPLPNLYGLTISEARMRVRNMLNMEFIVVCPSCITAADSSIARVTSQSPEFDEEGVVMSGASVSVFADKNFAGSPN
ncbi:MAG: PASTA domain-containing protein [Crocinitomicaceae bacterium]|mgnify:CR=1 FL=1